MRLILAALFVLLPSVALGQISAVSGEITSDEVLVISGANFGTKTTAAPFVFDDVESGAFSDDWQDPSDGMELEVGTDSRHGNSTYCATADMGGSTTNNRCYFTTDNTVFSEKWFAQFWVKLDANWNWGTTGYGDGGENLANVKIFRTWNPTRDENFYTSFTTYSETTGLGLYNAEYVSNPQAGYYSEPFENPYNIELDEWHLFQFQYQDSSVGGNDGIFKQWIDCELIVDDSDLMTRETYSEFKRIYILGFYNAWSDDGADPDDFYMDEMYADTSWSRVEIGNASTYAACTHREMQIPSAWATGEVTVTVNTGSFSTNDNAYLFVVDSDGTASAGYAVTIGESGGTTALQGCGTITATKAE